MKNSNRHLTHTLAAALALAAGFSANAAAYTYSNSETTYRCDSAPNGECHHLLYVSTCKEAGPVNGKPSLVCSLSYLQEFSLKVGQSKKLSNLPAGVRLCPVKPGEKSVFPACAM